MSSHETVRVDLGSRSYDIVIGDDVLAEAGKSMAPILRSPRVVVVTDDHVAPLHLHALMRSLANAEIAADAIVLPAGEQTKDIAHFGKLLDEILGRGIDRDTSLVALGGGVIGDITGFAAASALRGIDFIQVPTTLLAQVDSSVGGKTGINSPHGKNLIGAFHQPRLVLADSRVLRTLPRREMLAGYAEAVKYGLIADEAFFAWLEGHGADLVDGDPVKIRHAVVASCKAKAAIVAEDEKEHGARALLNLGHTFGHALEAETGFGHTLLHGEAVAIGMVMAFDLSVRMGLCPAEDAARVRRHLGAVGLPTGTNFTNSMVWSPKRLIGHMAKDKKVTGGQLTFILTRGIGEAFVTRDVPGEELTAFMEGAVAA
ncbi:MAG: 3-dehydroquinate synthase [Alphaproteobacteria bacterium]|nr:3-dehydroquinate synthase [Alphaproteobacteria bacterium]